MSEKGIKSTKLLIRGESMVATWGLALASILLGVIGASAVWMHRSEQGWIHSARADEVRAIGSMLAQSSEGLLASGDLSTVRRLVVDAAQYHELTSCTLLLPDGGVLADSAPTKITVSKVPEQWGGRGLTEVIEQITKQSILVEYPIRVPGRGELRLVVSGDIGVVPGVYWDAQAGVGAIGAIAFLALLIVYRKMRSRFCAVGAVREALLSFSSNPSVVGSLRVSESMGLEAVAWNYLLAHYEELQKELLADKAAQSLETRRDSREDLAGPCDAMSQGLVVIDDRLMIKYANGAASAFLGMKRDEIVGAEVGDVFSDERVLELLKGMTQGNVKRSENIEVGSAEGDELGVLNYCIRPVRRSDSAAAMIVIEDITQQRVAETTRSQFVAQATHELRTPLTNIRLYVEQAIEEGDKDPALRAKSLNVISQESRRLERIVGEMLSVSEIEAGSLALKRGDVRLDALFADLEADYQAMAAEKELTLRFDLPPKMPVIQADREKFVLALHNLVGNALKYTLSGGEVVVKLQEEDASLAVAIIDNGIGISEEDQKKIFDRFYRANDRRIVGITGSGLGLALARDVIRLHGGDITVQSVMDKGSIFTLRIPAPRAAA